MTPKLHNLVYCTTHRPSGRYYIGVHCTNNLNDGYRGSGGIIKGLLNKYDADEFDFKVIAKVASEDDAYDLEEMIVQPFLIDKVLFPLVCNLRPGGLGGRTPTAETRAKLSLVSKGLKRSDETRQKMREANKGKNKGRKHTPETRAKVSAATSGENNPRFGKPVSEEQRAKTSAANKGRTLTSEQRAKISKALTGITHNYEPLTCPHCAKVGRGPNMSRYHFNNCRFKPN